MSKMDFVVPPHDKGWLTKNMRDPEFAAAYQRECERDAAYATAEKAVHPVDCGCVGCAVRKDLQECGPRFYAMEAVAAGGEPAGEEPR